MSVASLSILMTRGEELYNIIAHRFMNEHLFEASVLDIYKDLTMKRDFSSYYQDMSSVEATADIFSEEMADIIAQFGKMAAFEPDEIEYAWQKWCSQYEPQLCSMVEHALLNNQGFCSKMLLPDRMDIISPDQCEIFPQFRGAAMADRADYVVW